MKKTHKFIILFVVSVLLFIILHYLTHDVEINNFVIEKEEKTKLTNKEAEELGNDFIKKALMFYESTPGNTKGSKEINDEEYKELKPFLNEAKKIFNKEEINDFLDYYKIKKENKKYYIKESNNELKYIYDEVLLKPRYIGEERIIFKATWFYCDVKSSALLSECEDTKSMSYKNTFVIEKKKDKWKIIEFSLPI